MKPIQVYIPNQLHEDLRIEAFEKHTTISDLVRERITRKSIVEGDIDRIKEVFENKNGTEKYATKLCKTHGLPVTGNGKCLQKGCKG